MHVIRAIASKSKNGNSPVPFETICLFQAIVLGYKDVDTSNSPRVADSIAKEFGSDLLIVHSLTPAPRVLGVVSRPAEGQEHSK
jgi:hypothetical protein